MPEQPRQLANKYEDIVNLQGAGTLWQLPAQLVLERALRVHHYSQFVIFLQ